MCDVTAYPGEAWKRLGRTVRQARVAKKMSQKKLAEAAGVGVNTITAIETGDGERRELTLVNVCEALGWTPDSYFRVLEGDKPAMAEAEPEPVRDDALRYERPTGLDDREWDELKAKLDDDYAFWLKMRRRD